MRTVSSNRQHFQFDKFYSKVCEGFNAMRAAK